MKKVAKTRQECYNFFLEGKGVFAVFLAHI